MRGAWRRWRRSPSATHCRSALTGARIHRRRIRLRHAADSWASCRVADPRQSAVARSRRRAAPLPDPPRRYLACSSEAGLGGAATAAGHRFGQMRHHRARVARNSSSQLYDEKDVHACVPAWSWAWRRGGPVWRDGRVGVWERVIASKSGCPSSRSTQNTALLVGGDCGPVVSKY